MQALTYEVDALTVLAEVSVGLAGFGSLVFFVSSERSARFGVPGVLLRAMLINTLSPALAAVATIGLLAADLDHVNAWRLGSLIWLIPVLVGAIPISVLDQINLAKRGEYPSKWLAAFFWLVALTGVALQLVNALAVASPSFLLLFFGFVSSATAGTSMFFYLIFSLASSDVA